MAFISFSLWRVIIIVSSYSCEAHYTIIVNIDDPYHKLFANYEMLYLHAALPLIIMFYRLSFLSYVLFLRPTFSLHGF